MSDKKLTDATIPETTDIDGTELIYIVEDPSGTPVSNKITVENLLAYVYDVVATLTNKTFGAATLSGQLSAADQTIERPVIKDYGEAENNLGTMGATETVDLELANFAYGTLGANCTLTFSNPPASGTLGSLTLELTQDGTGSRTVTWPASVTWPAGTPPTLSTGAGDVDVFTFYTRDGGTTWRGFTAGLDLS